LRLGSVKEGTTIHTQATSSNSSGINNTFWDQNGGALRRTRAVAGRLLGLCPADQCHKQQLDDREQACLTDTPNLRVN
jgi:hypothetical protein